MCGITGVWSFRPEHSCEQTLIRMNDALRHRGPDDRGVVLHKQAGLGLAQRRLSIIDLSAAGHQPMLSHCGRYDLVFNGEIYNHLALREQLLKAGYSPDWRGHSDSETLLAAITHWGFHDALKRLNGMFAIALWDRHQNVLYLARDRMGEKPLYYGWLKGVFVFASELKAIREHPAWTGQISRPALAQYMKYTTVPAPLSIYQDIFKLPAAHALRITTPERQAIRSQPYWNLPAIAQAGQSDVDSLPTVEHQRLLHEQILQAVRLRMMADVPLGAFLSGGIDSSMIVAAMQAQSMAPVKTFTIGFEEQGYDEAPHARAVADHLGTEHTELYVSPEQAQAVLPELAAIWDEPFADSSQIPTLLVSRLTRQSVTVSLSGDGGDELFHGYSRYTEAVANWNKLRRLPVWIRRVIARVAEATALPSAAILQTFFGGHPQRLQKLLLRVGALARGIGCRTDDALYDFMLTYIKQDVVLDEQGRRLNANVEYPPETHSALQPYPNRMMLADMQGYLPETILTKVDRASMSVGLEARAPLLDHQLVEHAWRLPLSLKYTDGQGKWILRQILYDYVPVSILERPKMGFGVPIDSWLRGPLREWAETLIDERKLAQQGYLDPLRIRQMWNAHMDRTTDFHFQLWPVLQFQAWLESAGAGGSANDN